MFVEKENEVTVIHRQNPVTLDVAIKGLLVCLLLIGEEKNNYYLSKYAIF